MPLIYLCKLESDVHCDPSCIVVGTVEAYVSFSISLWWFMLTAALFWKIWFPINARMRETKRQIKYIHIACVLIGTLIPLIPVMLKFTGGKPGFNLVRFPPLPCTGSDTTVSFYSGVFPTDILVGIGITFVILIFWRVHKVSSKQSIIIMYFKLIVRCQHGA